MALLSLRDVSFAWGGPLLLDGVDLEIEKGEHIGLLGRNGSGKSTLMRMLAGEIDPDDGEIRRTQGLTVARLIQEVPHDLYGCVSDIVQGGYEQQGESDPDDWKAHQAVERVLSKMTLDGQADFPTLSSGMKRRVLLARALVSEPDVLLLDEPTNHLDITAISWLERFLKGYPGTLLFVTHDRVFLQALATRIIEIDRGKMYDWSCDYATFLVRKQQMLESEEKHNAAFDRKLAQEEVWIRQGIKARRTRNEGRVRALKKLRDERSNRRERTGNVRMQAAAADRSGQLVVEAKNISFAYDETPIVNNFSTLISRGDKIGIIGPNGSGKTTLLKLLLGQLEPTSGVIRRGTRMEVLYFDQLREQLDEEKTVVENVGGGQDMLLIDGRQKHIYGYLQDFLFTPERARRPARYLSGGERNRLLLAKLFTKSSNVLVLDEPTNDLDTETLELLEELVSNYKGTLLLVSHDRAFLDNVVTSTFAFGGNGEVKEYDGGYESYMRQRATATARPVEEPQELDKPPVQRPTPKLDKLNFNERRELDALPAKLAALETEQSELHTAMADPEFFKQDGAVITKATSRLESLDEELGVMYARWEELEARA